MIFALPVLWKILRIRIIELSISEGGNGKDFTDTLVQKQKQMLRYQVDSTDKGSACSAWECKI